jgi:general secretion pathway protein L
LKPKTSWAAPLLQALDDAAAVAWVLESRLRRRRRLCIVEDNPDRFSVEGAAVPLTFDSGAFTAETPLDWRGVEVELVLSERRFLYPTLTLPQQASDFLDAMVRSQIDRLTPWTRLQAAFGFVVVRQSDGRIEATVAVAARAALEPYVAAAEARGALSVKVRAPPPQGRVLREKIEVFTREVGRSAEERRLRAAMAALALIAAFAAIASFAARAYAGAMTEASAAALVQLAAEARARIAAPAVDPGSAAVLLRKLNEPPTVIILEALSNALPDDSYLTEFQLSDRRLEIQGVSRGPAQLVKILEETKPFQHVQFSAATTPTPDGGEEFHLEAEVAANGWRP